MLKFPVVLVPSMDVLSYALRVGLRPLKFILDKFVSTPVRLTITVNFLITSKIHPKLLKMCYLFRRSTDIAKVLLGK